MNILNKLSLKNLKLNKKRTIGTIIGIILSTSLICASSGMFTSFRETLIKNAINEDGYYHVALRNIKEEDINSLKLNRDIKEIKTIDILGFAYLENLNKDYPYIEVSSMNKNTFDDLSYEIIEGKFPNNSDEILINKKTAKDASLKVGDTIELNIGKRQIDGFDLNSNNPYTENEYLINTKTKTYKIVGIGSKSVNYTYWGVTVDSKSDNKDGYIILKNPKNQKEAINRIRNIKEDGKNKYGLEENYELLRWEAFAFSDSTVSALYTVLSVVILIIAGTSIFCIKNSFAISCSEKMKMYGMLSSIGATKKQIRKSVKFEGLILGLIGIPLGILSGIFAVYIVILIINLIAGDLIMPSLGGLQFKISVLVIIVAIIISFITIYLSALSSSIKAGKVSPIINLKNNNEIKISSKKLKTPKIINKIFKTGGVLAYKNLKRSKRKYRTTIISLTISILSFISMNAFIYEMFDVTKKYYEEYEFNLSVTGNLNEETLESIKKLEEIEKIYTTYRTKYYLKITDMSKIVKTDYMILNCESERDKFDKCPTEEYLGLQILALDNVNWKEYLKNLNLSETDAKGKGILTDNYMLYDGKGNETEIRSYNYKSGEKIIGSYENKNLEITVAHTTNVRPIGLDDNYYYGGYLIVNKDDFKNIDFEMRNILINSKDAYKTEDDIIIINEDLYISNYDEVNKSNKAFKLVFSIFMYGFITVITLIGVTNIFNTITSNIELRSKEFAMLKSIGMTKKEFNRMINLETLFYSTKSLIYGIFIGIILSYLIHISIGEKTNSPFKLPMTSVAISIIFVVLIVFIIMKYSVNKVNKKNTIETIRRENI